MEEEEVSERVQGLKTMEEKLETQAALIWTLEKEIEQKETSLAECRSRNTSRAARIDVLNDDLQQYRQETTERKEALEMQTVVKEKMMREKQAREHTAKVEQEIKRLVGIVGVLRAEVEARQLAIEPALHDFQARELALTERERRLQENPNEYS
eukprot:GEMP01076362.1.p1 GENE.GEMP01076362.1~~GEMP01076362.1.p1  ORF type:complete len:154 (+),score=45.04 GEMP01076362.1:289-750(+)